MPTALRIGPYRFYFVLVNQMLHLARRAKALGFGYQARRRGLKLCDINLTSTVSVLFLFL